MKLIIEIDMDNAAFEDDPICEATRIIRQQTDRGGEFALDLILDRHIALRDSNGNTCGTVSVIID